MKRSDSTPMSPSSRRTPPASRFTAAATLFGLFAVLACGSPPDDADRVDAVGEVDTGEAVDATDGAVDSAASPDGQGGDVDGGVDAAPTTPAWTPLPEAAPCPLDDGAPLLEAALAAVGLSVAGLTYDEVELGRSAHYYGTGLLDDAFLLPWQRPTLWAPARASCFARDAAVALDAILAGPTPVADAIRHAAARLDRWVEGPPQAQDLSGRDLAAVDLAAALALASGAAGRPFEAPVVGDLPPGLEAALVPVVLAIADALAARRAMIADAPSLPGGWVRSGGLGTSVFAPYGALAEPEVRAHLLGLAHRPRLNLAAARIAHAVETVDWSAYAGLDFELAIATPIGWFRIGGAGADTYPGDLPETWFLLELGGDDVYLNPIGATTEPSFGVNVAIDLGGADRYGYVEVATPHDAPGLAPADADGRYAGDDRYGPVTLSRHGRQGSGRHGVGLLFDLGGGDDVYRSLSMSQGYAHLGVGVLFDDGGADRYAAEQASQGAAAYGIGLLIDRGDADDTYRVFTAGQGSGSPGGFGGLHDEGGDDRYDSEVGLDDEGRLAIYQSAQLPGVANNSASQGAGMGIRWDAGGVFLSGGIGVLRDQAGDDTYRCAVFCQGAGFWQGTGLLSDGAGADRYDGLWYAQGGAAHYAIGALLDGGPGGDRFNEELAPRNVLLGAGHDFSLGLLVNEAGDDRYRFTSLAAGAGNCNGVGLFVDNGGDDGYETTSAASAGYASLGECLEDPTRPLARTVGVLLDGGGVDAWSFPEGDHAPPGDDRAFGHSQNGVATELGAGLDGAGITGLRAE